MRTVHRILTAGLALKLGMAAGHWACAHCQETAAILPRYCRHRDRHAVGSGDARGELRLLDGLWLRDDEIGKSQRPTGQGRLRAWCDWRDRCHLHA